MRLMGHVIPVAGVHVDKHHVRRWLAFMGFALMAADALLGVYLAATMPHALTEFVGHGGKTGAAMAGLAATLE